MRITVAMKAGVLRVRLGESLDIASAEEAKSRLQQVSESAANLELDLSSLVDIDTAGIQLLLALRRTREKAGTPVRIVHPSPSVLDAFRLVGLERIFDASVAVSREGGG